MRGRVHIVVPAHLAMAPRAQREAEVLQRAGYEVTVSGVWLNARLADIDREIAARLNIQFRPAINLDAGVGLGLRSRIKGRWARWKFSHGHRFSPALLGYGIREQLRLAQGIRADLTIAHGEAGLWIAHELRCTGQRVGIDFEDWFSRDLSTAERPHRPVDEIACLESSLLRHAHYRTASSEVMADALAAAFGSERPAVVTNAIPPMAEIAGRPRGPLRLIWVSQTIGPSRGLEFLFQALPLVRSSYQLTLLGALRAENRAWLRRLMPAQLLDNVLIEPPVEPWQLPDCIAAHDVGLVLETRAIVSRDLCLPNKLFHYFAGGLAVLATPTRALSDALALCPNASFSVDETKPHDLASAIEELSTNPVRLAEMRGASRVAGQTIWNSERDRESILSEVKRALNLPFAPINPTSDRLTGGATPRSPFAGVAAD